MIERLNYEDQTFYLDVEGVKEAEIVDFFKVWGLEYNGSSQIFGKKLLIDGSTVKQGGFFPFFNDEENFWHAVSKKKNKPNRYYILNKKFDENVFDQKIDYYFNVKSILREICQVENSDKINSFIFFTTKESFLKRIEINGSLSFEEIVEVDSNEEILNLANKILDITKNKDDVHSNERMHILRESLGEIFKAEDNRNIKFIIKRIKDFHKEYTERYNLYVSKFSINKIISEIENERVGMTCKIQDYLINQQTKAFAIPGASVALMAILRFANNTFDYLVLYLAYLLSSWMIYSINEGAIKQISLLLTEFNKTMSKYDDIEKGFEDINSEIIESKEQLKSLANNAQSKIEILTYISILSCIFMLIVVIEKSAYFTK